MKRNILFALIGLMLPLLAVAQEVSLSATSVAMYIGETGRLTATVSPANAVEKTVVWTSSNTTVATISNTGVVYAVGVGEATITATCESVSASCSLTVVPRDGDVNADGKHSVSDVTYTAGYIMETLAETNTFYKEAADIDKDGMVIVPDLTSIVDFVLDADNVPEAPQNVVATGRINTVLVNWDKVAGADSYIVYRSANGEDFEPIAFNVTEQSFVDEEPLDGTNYYKVGVVSGYAKSELSATVNAALVTEIPNNEIWYVTNDNLPIYIHTLYENTFGRQIISHEKKNGCFVIQCDGDITALQYPSFDNQTSIVELLLPNSIEDIGDWALNNIGVTKLHIPDKTKKISYRSLTNSQMERFTGKSVTSDGRCVIMDNTIYGFAPAGLEEYQLPNNVKVVHEGSFYNSGLKRIFLHEGLEEIKYDAFARCKNLESVTIPESVTYIGYRAFADCPNISGFYGNSKFITSDNKCLLNGNYINGFAGKGVTDYVIPEGIKGIYK